MPCSIGNCCHILNLPFVRKLFLKSWKVSSDLYYANGRFFTLFSGIFKSSTRLLEVYSYLLIAFDAGNCSGFFFYSISH